MQGIKQALGEERKSCWNSVGKYLAKGSLAKVINARRTAYSILKWVLGTMFMRNVPYCRGSV